LETLSNKFTPFCYGRKNQQRKQEVFITINIEIAFKGVKMKGIGIKPPGFVFSSTEDNQGIVEPIRQVGKAIETIVVVNCY
jgi:hypothetical protein